MLFFSQLKIVFKIFILLSDISNKKSIYCLLYTSYITPDGSYVYEFGDKAPLVKKQPEAGMKVQAAFVKENTTQVKVDGLDKYENPKVSVYYTTGSGHGKKTTYVVDHAVAENGVVTFDSSVSRAGDEIYTVMISSDNYVDMKKNITLRCV